MKRALLALLALAAALALTGCLDAAYDTSMPYYDGVISGSVNYPLSALGRAGKTYVLLSADRYLATRLGTVEVGADGAYKFSVPPGVYHLSAFRDVDGNADWTIGTDPIAGRIADTYDLFHASAPKVEMAKTETVDLTLLHPFEPLAPAHLATDVGAAPLFRWNALPGCDFYRVRVRDASGRSLWVFDTPLTECRYGKLPAESGEETLESPYNLFPGVDCEWVVIGLKTQADGFRAAVAYSLVWRFRI